MDTYAQLEALAAVIAGLADTGVWTERNVMETLLAVFTQQELGRLGYGDRVDAYLKDYGANDE